MSKTLISLRNAPPQSVSRAAPLATPADNILFANGVVQMITIYLDHNIIDGFDKGKTAYLERLLVNKGYQPLVSAASIDEIFRGGDPWSTRNIESLKRLGVKYIYSDPHGSDFIVSELDYENMARTWLKMQLETGPLHDSHFLFIETLFRGNEPEAIQHIDQAVTAKISWIKGNYDRFPNSQAQMKEVLRNPEEYKELCRQLIQLKKLLPFTSKVINNIPGNSVFWACVEKLKNADHETRRLIGNVIEDGIRNASTVFDQLQIVFLWLTFFGYWPDNMTRRKGIRSNYSDARHAEYGIACDAILTFDTKFAKRVAAAIGALKLRTEVIDANELLHPRN